MSKHGVCRTHSFTIIVHQHTCWVNMVLMDGHSEGFIVWLNVHILKLCHWMFFTKVLLCFQFLFNLWIKNPKICHHRLCKTWMWSPWGVWICSPWGNSSLSDTRFEQVASYFDCSTIQQSRLWNQSADVKWGVCVSLHDSVIWGNTWRAADGDVYLQGNHWSIIISTSIEPQTMATIETLQRHMTGGTGVSRGMPTSKHVKKSEVNIHLIRSWSNYGLLLLGNFGCTSTRLSSQTCDDTQAGTCSAFAAFV